MTYKVKTQETTWQHIIRYEENDTCYIFYWDDGDELIIKKELVLYILKKA